MTVRPPPPWLSLLLFSVWCGIWQWISHLPGRRAVQYDFVALARSDIDRISAETRRDRNSLAIPRNDLERATMDMHRVDEAVVGADETNLERLAIFICTTSVAG